MRFLALALFTLMLAVSSLSAQVTIDWWQFWTDPGIKPTIDSIVSEFEAVNPGVQVDVTDLTWANGHEKIAIAFASGTEPDVVELGSDWIAQFADAGHLYDMSADIATQRADYDGWSMAGYEGGIYGKPWILGTRVLFFNRDLVTRAGFDEDFYPFSWVDLREAIEKVTELAPNIYGWGSNTAEKHRLYKKFMPFLWSARGQILTDDGRYCVISSQQAVEALKFYKRLHDCCGYVATQRGIEDAFLDGQVGLIISGDWLLKRIELEKRRINFATVIIPGPDPTFGTGRKITADFQTDIYPGRSFMGGEFLAISRNSDHKEAALAFVNFVASPANQLRFCKANHSANPSSREAQQDEYFQSDPHLQTFVKQLRLSNHPPVDPNWVHMETELENAVEAVLFQDAPPGETLRQLQHTITELRKQ